MMKNGAEKPGPKKVAIVALGPSAGDYIQNAEKHGNRHSLYDEVWTVNTFVSVLQSDRLFHMDDFRVQEIRAEKNLRIREMLEAMKRYPNPIYTSVPDERWPTSVAYPLEQVIQKFGSMYFNNTMPYVIAYAMLIGVAEMHLYGMDYVWPNMAGAEAGRGCSEYWLGLAHAHGVRYRVCENSTLMDAHQYKNGVFPLYGYDAFKITMKDLGEGKLCMDFAKKDLPTAEEVERRYYKDRPADLEALFGAKVPEVKEPENVEGKHV